MGEIADQMINGETCNLCGCYFEDSSQNLYIHGYPVVCWDCWDNLTSKERKHHQKALVRNL